MVSVAYSSQVLHHTDQSLLVQPARSSLDSPVAFVLDNTVTDRAIFAYANQTTTMAVGPCINHTTLQDSDYSPILDLPPEILDHIFDYGLDILS